jgi:hypothetical protein
VLYLVEAEIEGGEFGKFFEAFDVSDKIVVQVEFADGGGEVGRKFDFLDLVLAETQALCTELIREWIPKCMRGSNLDVCESIQLQGRYRMHFAVN